MTDSPTPSTIPATSRHADVEITLEARTLPWLISLSLHALLVIFGFFIPWTTSVLLNRQEAPPARLAAASEEPLALTPLRTPDLTDRSTDPLYQDRASDRLASDLDRFDPAHAADPTDAIIGPRASPDALRGFAPRRETPSVSFGGLRAEQANRIVYVVDASGSMLSYLPLIIDELIASIDRLDATQSFRIVFFQNNEALVVPGPGDADQSGRPGPRSRALPILPATEAVKLHVFDWLNLDAGNIRATGKSNPIRALTTALNEIDPPPDLVYILSTDITGLGEFEVDQNDLLRMIHTLNRASDGSRRAVIKCIQFVHDDPLETLKKIAEEHGGPDGYRFLSRADLGLGP